MLVTQEKSVWKITKGPLGNIIAQPAEDKIFNRAVVFDPSDHTCFYKDWGQPPIDLPRAENIQEAIHHAIKKGLIK